MLPFDNIKVIDLTTRAPGPFCSMALADMGAEVVMVEAPSGVGSQGGPGPDEVREAAFDPLRRNKRSIVLDLKDAGARQALYDLAAGADVFMEGFKPGTVKRLGADYETLCGVNERLVYCSLSGYGQDGPYRAMPGHDVNYISFAGVLGSMGSPDGTPVIPNNIIADFAAGGLLGAFSIVTALWARERTGRGQYIDLSLTDGSVYLNAMVMKNFFLNGEKNPPGQAPLNGASPDYRVYRCKDRRFLSVGSLEFKFWRTLCEALARPDWVERRRSEPAAVAAEMGARFAGADPRRVVRPARRARPRHRQGLRRRRGPRRPPASPPQHVRRGRGPGRPDRDASRHTDQAQRDARQHPQRGAPRGARHQGCARRNRPHPRPDRGADRKRRGAPVRRLTPAPIFTR